MLSHIVDRAILYGSVTPYILVDLISTRHSGMSAMTGSPTEVRFVAALQAAALLRAMASVQANQRLALHTPLAACGSAIRGRSVSLCVSLGVTTGKGRSATRLGTSAS